LLRLVTGAPSVSMGVVGPMAAVEFVPTLDESVSVATRTAIKQGEDGPGDEDKRQARGTGVIGKRNNCGR